MAGEERQAANRCSCPIVTALSKTPPTLPSVQEMPDPHPFAAYSNPTPRTAALREYAVIAPVAADPVPGSSSESLASTSRRGPPPFSPPRANPPQTPSASSASTRPPSSRRALTAALELAQEAVRIDSSGEEPLAAIAAYGKSVALLNEVMERVMRGEGAERRRAGVRRRSDAAREDEVRRLKSIVGPTVLSIYSLRSLTFLSSTTRTQTEWRSFRLYTTWILPATARLARPHQTALRPHPLRSLARAIMSEALDFIHQRHFLSKITTKIPMRYLRPRALARLLFLWRPRPVQASLLSVVTIRIVNILLILVADTLPALITTMIIAITTQPNLMRLPPSRRHLPLHLKIKEYRFFLRRDHLQPAPRQLFLSRDCRSRSRSNMLPRPIPSPNLLCLHPNRVWAQQVHYLQLQSLHCLGLNQLDLLAYPERTLTRP